MLKFSIRNVFRKKGVALLSAIGIGFGLMLQFVLGSFSAGINEQVRSDFEKALGKVQITEYGEVGSASELPPDVVDVLLDSNFSEDIEAYNVKVELASKFMLPYATELQNIGDSLVLIGVNSSLDESFGGATSKILSGRVFNGNADEVILDSRLLNFNTSFSKDLNDNFTVYVNVTEELNLTITGIYEQDDSGAPSFVPRPYYAYVDILTAWKILGMEGDPNSTYTQIDLQFPAVDNDVTQDYIDQIDELSDSGAFNGTFVEAFSVGAFSEGIADTIGILETFTTVISFITLIAGGMSIIVAQLNSVSARMKEFAILKSTGWKNRHIFKDVVYESLTIGALGAILGLVISFALIFVIGDVGIFGTSSTVIIRPQLVLELVAFALGIGLVGGLYPGLKASRVRPVKVLKGE